MSDKLYNEIYNEKSEPWFIGIVAENGQAKYSVALEEVYKLRNDVYGKLSWGEAGHDEYDDHSAVFAAIYGDHEKQCAEIVMTVRIIINSPLPLEHDFQNVILEHEKAEVSRFVGNPQISLFSKEVSIYKNKTEMARGILLTKMQNYAYRINHYAYGIIEEKLSIHLQRIGISLKFLSESKALAEYNNTINYLAQFRTNPPLIPHIKTEEFYKL